MKTNLIKIAFIFFLTSKTILCDAQSDFYNNGSSITIQPGALITVKGELVNTNSGANIGIIDNSGLITLSGNWTNNSTSAALLPNTGTVEMLGANQFINGGQPTRFNNLILTGTGVKTLNVNTFVSGINGALALTDRPLDLNSKTLFVTNPLNTSITRTSGYIISETSAITGYGIIDWNIGNNTNNYIFPFGTLATNYIPLTLNITNAGVQLGAGSISASTYPTNTGLAINNRPLPTGVLNLNNNCNTEHAQKMLDRFWVINPNNYINSPITNTGFTYLDSEWNFTGASTNIITEPNLQVWHYNNNWQHLASVNNSLTNIQNIANNSNYGVFTLGEYKTFNMQLLDIDSVRCFGQSNGSLLFSSNHGYGFPTYSINGIPTNDTLISTLPAGSYTVIGTDNQGCKDTINAIKIDEPTKLMLALLLDKYSICKNNPLTLTTNYSGGIKPYSITWSDGTTTAGVTTNTVSQSKLPNTSTNYSAILTDSNNCTIFSNTVSVNVNPVPIVNFIVDVVEGCQALKVNFTNLSAANPIVNSWLWNFGDGSISMQPSPDYTYTLPGSYVVNLTAVTDSGCTTKYTLPNYILVHPNPKANFSFTPPFDSDILNPEVLFQNASTNEDNLEWNFGDTYVSYAQNPNHTFADTGTYQVSLVASTIYGCRDTITLPVKINEISTLYIPNAFTPDGNTLNDIFMPKGLELFEFTMQIFDRWGQKIFESADVNVGWDGKFRGALCKQDVYVYKIVFREKNGPNKMQEKTQLGHVTLMKLK